MKNNFNYCPKCGYKGLLWKCENNFQCTHCHFTYFHNQAAAVCIIICFEDTILFTRRKKDPAKGYLDLPGGFVDANETAIESALRELKEELDLSLEAKDLLFFDTSANDYPFEGVLYKTLDIAFITRLSNSHFVSIGDKEEIEEICWISPLKMNLEKIGFLSIRNLLKKYISSLS